MKHNLTPQENIIKKPTLDLLVHLNKAKLQKFQPILDTGYSGNLCINKDIANILNLEYLGKVRNLNIDNKFSIDDLYKINVEFPSFDLKNTKFRITCTAKDNLPVEMLIGQNLLDLFSNANDVSLVINYSKSEMYFQNEN